MKELMSAKLPIPSGFVITSDAFLDFAAHNNLEHFTSETLAGIRSQSAKDLRDEAKDIQTKIRRSEFPESLIKQIMSMYLSHGGGRVILQSNAIASNGTQLDTYEFFGCEGEANVFEAIKKLWSDYFTSKRLFDCLRTHEQIFPRTITILVQHLPSLSVSGVFFTTDPTHKTKDQILIKAVHGEGALSHTLENADYYWISKRVGEERKVVVDTQRKKIVWSHGKPTEEKVLPTKQKSRKISRTKFDDIAKLAHKIQQHFFYPQEVLFGIHGSELVIFNVAQAMTHDVPPETKPSSIPKPAPKTYQIRSIGKHTIGIQHALTQEGRLPAHPVLTGPLFLDLYPLIESLRKEKVFSTKLLTHQAAQKLQFANTHTRAAGGIAVAIDYQEARQDFVLPLIAAITTLRVHNPLLPISLALRNLNTAQEYSLAATGLRTGGLPRSSRVSYFLSIGVPRLLWEIDTFATKGLDGIILELDTLGSVLSGGHGDHREANESAALYDLLAQAFHRAHENGIRVIAQTAFVPSHTMLELLQAAFVESIVVSDSMYTTVAEKMA